MLAVNSEGGVLVRRFLADAEEVARSGEAAEAERLLRLALDLADGEELPLVLFRAKAVLAVEGGVLPVVEDKVSYAVPHFLAEAALASPPWAVAAVVAPAGPIEAVLDARRGSGGVREKHAGAGLPGIWRRVLVVGFLVAGFWYLAPSEWRPGLPAALDVGQAGRLLDAGDAKGALGVLRDAEVGRLPGKRAAAVSLLRGRARLALGDTAGAFGLLREAARLDPTSSEAAWQGALIAREIRGGEAVAADLFLVAVAVGLEAGRYPEVIAALERAGRVDQARRVRALASGGGGR